MYCAYIPTTIWATVNIWYIAPSHQVINCEECIIVVQVSVYKQMLSFFEECIIIFQTQVTQAQFPKKRSLEYYSPLTESLAVAQIPTTIPMTIYLRLYLLYTYDLTTIPIPRTTYRTTYDVYDYLRLQLQTTIPTTTYYYLLLLATNYYLLLLTTTYHYLLLLTTTYYY